MIKKIWGNICEYPWISGVIGVGLLFILGIFVTYGVTLGPLSHKHGAWSSFGSMLSGVFTLFGTTATIATLLFLSAQFKEQQKVTAKQIEALTFEQYKNHRSLFITRLEEISDLYAGQIKFRNPDYLYNKFFPRNNSSFCEFKLSSEYENKDLIQIYSSFDKLINLFQGKLDDYEVLDIVGYVDGISDWLQINYIYERRDGDVLFADCHLGINIYSLDSSISRLFTIFNDLLFFSGASRIKPLEYLDSDERVRFGFLKFYSRASARMEPYVVFNDDDLRSIHKVYVLVKEIHLMDYGVLNLLEWHLDAIFKSHSTLSAIYNKELLESFVKDNIKEIEVVLKNKPDVKEMEKIEEVLSILQGMSSKFFNAKLSQLRFKSGLPGGKGFINK